MKKFTVTVDEKCTIWYRNTFTDIEANSIEEAKAIAIKQAEAIQDGTPPDNNTWDGEYIFDTVETMTETDNDGQIVIEAVDELSRENK